MQALAVHGSCYTTWLTHSYVKFLLVIDHLPGIEYFVFSYSPGMEQECVILEKLPIQNFNRANGEE